MSEEKPKKLDLSAFMYSVNKSKENIVRGDPDPEKAGRLYPAFVANRLLSYHVNAVLVVDVLNNVGSVLPPIMHYEFALNALDASYRFDKMRKPEKDDDAKMIASHYRCSMPIARGYTKLISEDEMAKIRELNSQAARGGFA